MKNSFSHIPSNAHNSQNSKSQLGSLQNNIPSQAPKPATKVQQPRHEGFNIIKRQASINNFQNMNMVINPRINHQQFGLNPSLRNSSNLNGHYQNFSQFMQNNQFYPQQYGSIHQSLYPFMYPQVPGMSSPLDASSNSNSQEMIVSLFQIIESQAKSLQNLFEKVEKMTQKINQFGQKMKQAKRNQRQDFQNEQIINKPIEHINQNTDNIDAKTLIKILFGSNKVYNYRLQLNQSLDFPLYRERNFSISLKLIDSQGKLVKNHNKIPLSLAIYSSQNPPKFIQKNTAGQKILKGYIQQSLHFGQCHFEKIQIKQVTSHFRNGWVFIVIIPCMTPLGSANPNHHFIDYLKIQPLVIEKVIVKAKKIKQNKKGKSEKEESQLQDQIQHKDRNQVKSKKNIKNQLNVEEQEQYEQDNQEDINSKSYFEDQ